MADTTIKKWNSTGGANNDGAWEELYPETTVSQLVATGDRDSTTFLRGDGVFSDTLTDRISFDGGLKAGSTANNIAPINIKSDSENQAIHIEGNDDAESWQIGVDTDGNLNFYNSGSTSYSVRFNDNNTADFSNITRVYQGSQTALKTYSAAAGLQLVGYQSTSGSPYTKTSDIVANADGTVASQMRFFTKASGSSSPTERLKIESNGDVKLQNNLIFDDDLNNSDYLIDFQEHPDGTYGAFIRYDGSVSNALEIGTRNNGTETQAISVDRNTGNVDFFNDLNARGDIVLDANNNNEKLYISRYGSKTSEFTSISRGDLITEFYTKNDEETSTIRFRIDNTDTETGGGADANDRNFDFISDSNNARILVDGNTVWHSGNDGDGSGLSADYLDGFHGSSYLRNDIDQNYNGTLSLGSTTTIKLPNSAVYGIRTSTGHRVIDSVDATLRIGDTGKHSLITLHGQDEDDFKVYYGNTHYKIFHEGNIGQFLRSDENDTMSGNLTIDSASFASLTLDRESTTSSSIVQFTNNNGVVGGIGGFGNDGLQFRTTDGTQMVIDSLNNVGIGEESPHEKLTVGTFNNRSDIAIYRSGSNLTTNTNIGRLSFDADYNSSAITYAELVGHSNDLSSVRGSLDFKVKSTSGGILTGMTLYGTNDGVRLGVGTETPTNRFQVAGDARVVNLMAGDAATNNVPAKPIHIKGAGTQALRIEDTTSSNRVYDITADFTNGFKIENITGSTTPISIDTSDNITFTGNLKLEDHYLDVGNVGDDNFSRFEHTEADGFGFDFQYNNASTIQNLQGSTNQALVLGDLSNNDTRTLFGASILSSGTWIKKLNLTGGGDLYIGQTGTDKVATEAYVTANAGGTLDTSLIETATTSNTAVDISGFSSSDAIIIIRARQFAIAPATYVGKISDITTSSLYKQKITSGSTTLVQYYRSSTQILFSSFASSVWVDCYELEVS